MIFYTEYRIDLTAYSMLQIRQCGISLAIHIKNVLLDAVKRFIPIFSLKHNSLTLYKMVCFKSVTLIKCTYTLGRRTPHC